MSIEQKNKVDMITQLNDKVVLVISDDLEWDEKNQKLLLLQDKLNAYLSFIESGQLSDKYPNLDNNRIQIRLISKYAPNAEAEKFLSIASQSVKQAGFELALQFAKVPA
ncbi:hypothetical protein SAMN04488136_15011 [Vibrio xiamenensis]|uniref:Uncharacterized protein n=1 Tax=Vibrio xiamenensis TaxID=861298 RepID=A0A1G8HEV8_9VIBR|nr:DUF6572 domain-containing protein [Vibrio xiamenensis]SDI05163.1 hypothetical protein SAMN04488136_15011 [Vibrio xiamenensis]